MPFVPKMGEQFSKNEFAICFVMINMRQCAVLFQMKTMMIFNMSFVPKMGELFFKNATAICFLIIDIREYAMLFQMNLHKLQVRMAKNSRKAEHMRF